MYRNDMWAEGHYIDNHKKYECFCCEKTFIVGRKLLEMSKRKNPICPYCGSSETEWITGTLDNQLEELASELGCLAIYIDEKELEE